MPNSINIIKIQPPDTILLQCVKIFGFTEIFDYQTIIYDNELILNPGIILNSFKQLETEFENYIENIDISTVNKCIKLTRKLLRDKELDIVTLYKMENYKKYKAYQIAYYKTREIQKNKYKPKIITWGW